MFNPTLPLLRSLPAHPSANKTAQIIISAFKAVEPGTAVKKNLHANPLPAAQKIYALGLGKAACAMTEALADEIHITDTLIITKHASPLKLQPVTVIEGNHPVPGLSSLHAGRSTIKFLSQLTQDDLLVCLISGGGSALMVAPRIPLEELQILTSALLACGARIDEINTLRRHLDLLKGGGLVRQSNGAHIISLLLSDVVGDTLEAIASGPTAPDPTTLADTIAILEKYNLKKKIPATIYADLSHSESETLKPHDPVFEKVENRLIASNSIALQAAQSQAELQGFQTEIITSSLQGEASTRGEEIARNLKESLQVMKRPYCLLAGGETTVTIKGNGKGGRNQEFALAAVDVLSGLQDVMLISIATDGEDGPTDAAGAFVTGETAQRAEWLGMFAADHLLRNDAYSYFKNINQLINTGPSGTNVNDLVLCFAF